MTKKLNIIVIWLFTAGLLLTAIHWFNQNTLDTKPTQLEFDIVRRPTLEDWQKQYPGKIKSFTIESQPTNLPANLEHPGVDQSFSATVAEDLWIIGFEPEIVGAPKNTLHHADLYSTQRNNVFCNLYVLLLAVGKEFVGGFAKVGYGYAMNQGEIIENYIMYHNPNDTVFPDAQVRIKVWYIPKDDHQLKELLPIMIDIGGGCGGSSDIVPPHTKKIYRTQPGREFVFPVRAEIISVSVHLHDFSEYYKVFVNGQLLHTFVPATNAKSEIITLDPIATRNLYLNEGDIITMEASYDNTSDQKIESMVELFMTAHVLE